MSYAEAIKAPMRQMTTRGSITPAGGAAIPLTGEHIVEWSLEEGGEFPLGSSVSSRLTLRLANTGGEWSSGGSLRGSAVLIGGTVALEVGVMDEGAYIYENIGVFAIESVKYNEGDTSISITGSDALMGLTDTFTDYGGYPLTLSAILTNMVTQSGLTLDPSFNSLPCNGSVSVTKKPDWGENVTYRQVLAYICAAGGAFVRTGRNGLLQIVPAYNPTPVYEIDTSMYMTLTDDENAFTFNRVKVDYGENESYSASVDGGIAEAPTNTITISENPIFFKYKTTSYTKATGTFNPEGTYYLRKNGLYQKAQTPKEATFNAGDYYKRTVSSEDATSAQAIATGLKAFLTGMTFRGMNIRWRGDPLLKIGDRVELTNRAGGSISTSVHHQILTYKNGLSADISCEIDTVAINAVYTGGGSPIIAIDGAALPGTDADTLNGHDSTYFATADHAHDSTYLKLTDVLSKTYPIGAVYLSSVNTSPAAALGGTWESVTPPSGMYAWKRTA